jgi:hypothetical protein
MGLVIITVLGVFVAGNNALKKGKARITGINIAEKKITEVRNLLAIHNKPNTDISGYIDPNTISGTITSIDPSSNMIVWKDPPAGMTSAGIYGNEEISITGVYIYEIKIQDFINYAFVPTYNLKQVTVTIYWIDPVSGKQKIVTMSSLISKE